MRILWVWLKYLVLAALGVAIAPVVGLVFVGMMILEGFGDELDAARSGKCPSCGRLGP